MVGGDEGIGKSEHDQAAMLRAVLERAMGLEHGDAGALRSHQGAGHVEPVLGQQFVEVIAGNTAGNLGKTLPDKVA